MGTGRHFFKVTGRGGRLLPSRASRRSSTHWSRLSKRASIPKSA